MVFSGMFVYPSVHLGRGRKATAGGDLNPGPAKPLLDERRGSQLAGGAGRSGKLSPSTNGNFIAPSFGWGAQPGGLRGDPGDWEFRHFTMIERRFRAGFWSMVCCGDGWWSGSPGGSRKAIVPRTLDRLTSRGINDLPSNWGPRAGPRPDFPPGFRSW